MTKYNTQFKLKVVKEYLKFGGLKRIAHLFEINTSDIRKWTLAYQTHGISSLKKRASRHYTPEFKLSVLQFMKDNQLSARPTAAHFNIPGSSSVLLWQRLYNEGGIKALESKPKGRVPMPTSDATKKLLVKPLTELTRDELLRKAQYLEVENAYLKKLEALAQKKRSEGKIKRK
jgi:transposase